MTDVVTLAARHGYILIFSIALAEAIGLPVPAALALVAGGAAAAAHGLNTPAVIALGILAMAIGDTLLFIAGRYAGWALLGVLCRISINPESCILRSAESFYKRGKTTLLFAKFIPGLNTMAPPLAGSMKMPFGQFARFDFVGACLYVVAYFTLGYLSRDFVSAIARGFHSASHAIEIVMLIAALIYIAYRLWLIRKNANYRLVPRVQVQELAQRLSAEGETKPLIVDVRSHGYYDAGAERIKGSIRLEPNNLSDELKAFPKERDIYLYCT